MEEANQIFSYLPLRYKNSEEAEYVQYLWKAFENNYDNEQYQFAYMSYHMLFMCFVYFTIWKIKSIHPEDFDKIAFGFDDCMEKSYSPFGYSKEQERKIMSIFRFWGIPQERIGAYKKLVDERNKIAHSNGNIFYRDQQSIDNRIADIIQFCQEIQSKTKSTIQKSYIAFLLENYSVEDSPYSTLKEMFGDEFISKHYISEMDIKLCCMLNTSNLVNTENYHKILSTHNNVVKLYKDE
jgi:hypothetical protein